MNTDKHPLHKALDKENSAEIKRLIADGVDVNTVFYNEYQAVHYAAALPNGPAAKPNKMLNTLLDAGADPNARRESDGQTPLHLSVFYSEPLMVNTLMTHGADINARANDGATPLLLANSSRPDLVQLLVETHGADPNVADHEGRTALAKCSLHPGADDRDLEFKTMKILLRAGADPNVRDEQGASMLHRFHHDDEAVQLLLAHNADPFAKDAQGQMPSHRLAETAREEQTLREQASAVRAASKAVQAFPSMDQADSYAAEKRAREPVSAEPASDLAPRPARRLV